MKLVGQEVIPDSDSLGDWLRRMRDPQTGQTGLRGLAQVRDLFHQRLLRYDGIGEYTLDADAMPIEAEKREATWTYIPYSVFCSAFCAKAIPLGTGF
jgi:hypothetical protein